MDKPRLFGAAYSVYVRMARLALLEKGVDHALVTVDIFDPAGPPGWYRERHPFLRVPAFEHEGFRLFEAGAITRYVDEAFDGPPLQPKHPATRARMNQILSILDSYAYGTLVWDIYVERVSKPKEGGTSDEARIAAAVARARTCLETLAALKGNGEWLAGNRLSLADIHAAPMLSYFFETPEGMALFADTPALHEWWQALSTRPSMAATAPA